MVEKKYTYEQGSAKFVVYAQSHAEAIRMLDQAIRSKWLDEADTGRLRELIDMGVVTVEDVQVGSP